MRRGIKMGFLGASLVGVLLGTSGCGYNIPPNMVAVHITSGPFQSKKIVGCVDSSQRKYWTNDKYPLFPTSEREWDATGQKGSDNVDQNGHPITFQSVTHDKVLMDIPVTVRFTLKTPTGSDDKTGCKTLEDFYLKYAQRYGASFNSDGTYNDQWETLLRKLVSDPSDQSLDRIVQQYNWQDVWNDPKTKVAITDQLNAALNDQNSLLVQTAKGSYFEGLSVLIGTPHPDNTELSDAVASEQTKVAQSDALRAQAKAEKEQALAEVAVAKAQAEKQRATIEGYRLKGMSPRDALRAYNESLAIAAGQNPFQPQYIVGGTVPAPSGQ